MVITLLGVIEEVVVLQYTQINCNLLEIKPMTVEHIFECVSVELSIKNYSNVIIN